MDAEWISWVEGRSWADATGILVCGTRNEHHTRHLRLAGRSEPFADGCQKAWLALHIRAREEMVSELGMFLGNSVVSERIGHQDKREVPRFPCVSRSVCLVVGSGDHSLVVPACSMKAARSKTASARHYECMILVTSTADASSPA